MVNQFDGEDKEVGVCPNVNCGFNYNEPGANFCMLCGTLLYQRCDDCLDTNPKYAKFCYHCGTSIEDLRNYNSGFDQESDIAATGEVEGEA